VYTEFVREVTFSSKLGVERSTDPKPFTVDTSDALDIYEYGADPRPTTEDTREGAEMY
jgi:hypothetical protein